MVMILHLVVGVCVGMVIGIISTVRSIRNVPEKWKGLLGKIW